MDRHKSARMTDVPSFAVPEIVVEDENNDIAANNDPFSEDVSPFTPEETSGKRKSYFTTGIQRVDSNEQPSHHRRGTDASQGGSQHSLGPQGFASTNSSPTPSPNLAPHRPSNSAFSFDLDRSSARLSVETGRPASAGGSGASVSSAAGSRGSAAENAMDILRDSAWGESLRRSYTQRRSRGGSNSGASARESA